MIGELIKQFENMPTNTVADFNKVFKDNMLLYPLDYEVEIGEVFNGVRQLIVNGDVIYVDLTTYGLNFKNIGCKKGNEKRVKVFYSDNTFFGEFENATQAARELNIDVSSFYGHIKTGKLIVEKS